VKIDPAHIRLAGFLRAVDAAFSGGGSMMIICEELVKVNGRMETKKGRKLYPGDVSETAGEAFSVK